MVAANEREPEEETDRGVSGRAAGGDRAGASVATTDPAPWSLCLCRVSAPDRSKEFPRSLAGNEPRGVGSCPTVSTGQGKVLRLDGGLDDGDDDDATAHASAPSFRRPNCRRASLGEGPRAKGERKHNRAR
jgi:hypothetical protein